MDMPGDSDVASVKQRVEDEEGIPPYLQTITPCNYELPPSNGTHLRDLSEGATYLELYVGIYAMTPEQIHSVVRACCALRYLRVKENEKSDIQAFYKLLPRCASLQPKHLAFNE
jgi:hypothetical protein